jgi:hypothetical protein
MMMAQRSVGQKDLCQPCEIGWAAFGGQEVRAGAQSKGQRNTGRPMGFGVTAGRAEGAKRQSDNRRDRSIDRPRRAALDNDTEAKVVWIQRAG